MSKAVRIRNHLYEEIERLAKQERRSLIAQLEVLLEQALRIEGRTGADAPPRDGGVAAKPSQGGRTHGSESVQSRARPAVTDPHFKPDFKKEKK